MNWNLILENLPLFGKGILVSLFLTATSVLFGLLLSIPLAVMRISSARWVATPVAAFTFVVRGTPAMVQLFLIYYGLSQFEMVRESILWAWFSNATFCAIFAFVINTTAYTTEIFAGGLRSIPSGEVEAAQSVGMRKITLYRRILIPSMLRRALPQYSNEVIMMLHMSSLASLVTMLDITGVARFINAQFYLAFEPFMTAGAIYLVLTLLLVKGFRMAERKWLAYLQPRASEPVASKVQSQRIMKQETT
ncbi:ABC transporter permease [Undibacterium arcticum]